MRWGIVLVECCLGTASEASRNTGLSLLLAHRFLPWWTYSLHFISLATLLSTSRWSSCLEPATLHIWCWRLLGKALMWENRAAGLQSCCHVGKFGNRLKMKWLTILTTNISYGWRVCQVFYSLIYIHWFGNLFVFKQFTKLSIHLSSLFAYSSIYLLIYSIYDYL